MIIMYCYQRKPRFCLTPDYTRSPNNISGPFCVGSEFIQRWNPRCMSKNRPHLAAPSQVVLVRLFFFFFTHVSAKCEAETPHSTIKEPRIFLSNLKLICKSIVLLCLHMWLSIAWRGWLSFTSLQHVRIKYHENAITHSSLYLCSGCKNSRGVASWF